MGQDEGRGPEQEVHRHLKCRRQPDQLHGIYATVPGLDLHDHRPVKLVDGSLTSTVAMLTGLSPERIEELGGTGDWEG